MKSFTRLPAYQLATTEVKRFIEQHQLKGGDPLPSEAVLCQELGMSRASLREGLKSLESLGIIRTRHGEGVFVAHFSFDPILHNLPYSIAAQGSSLRELLQVRCALEVGMISQVVANIGPSDVDELSELAQQMLQCSERGESFAELDRAFHATLFRCLDNTFLLSLVDLFWQVFNRLSDRLPVPDAAAQRATAQDHLAVAQMVQSGDVQALERAHRHHFNEISRRLDAMYAPVARPH
ncbi:MAG: FadR family transcriptional regulator [Rhodoferax sp.]|nr:FadR family transcriptional regulator [Rhodoferax sp.]